MRKRIFDIIEVTNTKDDVVGIIYDLFMLTAIIVSIVPLAFKRNYPVFDVINIATAYIFVVDYLARIATADLKLKRGAWSFVLYPFTPMALIDLMAILPSLIGILPGLRLVRLVRIFRFLRVFRTFRVFRSFKMFRYAKSIRIMWEVIKDQQGPLLAVCSLAAGYIFISALIIFNVEPTTFETFFEAVYWATVSLTTVGYGDIYPVSTAGQVVTMISSVVGVAVVALPASIITAGYMERIHKDK